VGAAVTQPYDEEGQRLLSHHLQMPRPQDMPDLPEGHELAAEWKAYKREVVRLLTEGRQGRFALLKGDAVHSIWDTRGDAMQAGRRFFGLVPMLVQEIQPFVRPLRLSYSRR
jgi:hypothetical protein